MPILDWRELSNIVDKKQKGYEVDSVLPDGIESMDNVEPEQWEAYDSELQDFLNRDKKQRFTRALEDRNTYSQDVRDIISQHDGIGDDYGAYRKDANIAYEDWIKDPVNYRANVQTNAAKIANGLGKMGIYGISTYLDNTAGLIAGLLNFGADAMDMRDGFKPVSSFINNPLSQALQGLRDWSEKALPNYRTTEETEEQDQWWKHLNANFWGDVVLKNLGFTLGAGAAAGTMAGIGRAMRGKIVNNAYKAAVAASVNGDVAAENAFNSVIRAASGNKAQVASNAFSALRPSFKKMNFTSQVLGGIGGAVGEARVEAMSAAKEFRDGYIADTQADFERDKQALADSIAQNKDYQGKEYVYDGFGNIIGERPALNAAGREAWELGLSELQNKYNSTISTIDRESEKLANKTFWYNMPVLTASNIVMFGRLMSGGYRSQFKNVNKVRGSFGNYSGAGTKAGAVAKGFMNATTEGLEELSQKAISESRKDIAEHNMAAFHNGKYDKDSIKGLSEWWKSVSESAGNVLADNTSWQEFAVGFLTGALGMPTHLGVSNWSGGIIGGIQEANQRRKLNNDAADALNKRISDQSFKDLWQGLVRNNTYELEKEDAVDKNDEYRWHNANDKQILSDVIMFDNSGKLNDLEDYIDSFANIKLEDIPEVSQNFIDQDNSEFNTKSDQQKLDWIHQRANEVKRTIEKYRGYNDTFNDAYTGELKNEFLYSRVQLDNLEDRYNTILPDVINDVKGKLESENTEKSQELLSKLPVLNNIFGEKKDKFSWNDAVNVSDKKIDEVKSILDSIKSVTDKEDIKNKIGDLKKIVNFRQNLYSRIFNKEGKADFIAKFVADAITDEEAANDIHKDDVNQKLDGLNDIASIKERYNNLSTPEAKSELVSNLRTVSDSNSAAKDFVNTVDGYDRFRKYLSDNAKNITKPSTGGFSNVAEIILGDVFQKSNNEKELIDNLINSLPSLEQVTDAMQGMVNSGAISEDEAMPILVKNQYDNAIDAIKKVAESYRVTSSKTDGREASTVSPESKPERNSKITGVDNPEPATESKAPSTAPATVDETPTPTPVQPQQAEQVDELGKDALSPSTENAIIDAVDSSRDTTLSEEDATTSDRNGDSVLGYYQQSFPEIQIFGKKGEPNVFKKLKALVNRLKVATDKKEVSQLNEQISMLPRDFVQFDKDGKPVGKNASFGETYKWLRDNHAFDYIATQLNINDELVFCYMAGCPRYDGVPQVVVGVVKSRDEQGNINAVQPLTTLHRPNSVSSEARVKYAYLDELYDAIQSDFESRGPDGPLYIFGGKQNPKTSKVFGIRPGIVPFSTNNNRIDQIDGYSEDAPIVMIGENNEPIILRGNAREASKIFIPTRNNATNRYGQLYYMVRNGGSSYTPIALGRHSLSKEVFDSAKEGGFVDGIKQQIAKIDSLINELTDTNAAEMNQKLSPILKELNTKMVLNGVFFEFKNIRLDDGSSANGLSIKWGNGKDENAFIESMSSRNTLDVIASLDRPIQLSPLENRRKDTINNLSGAISDGLIDTNAEVLRQKGVNFMFDPWNPQTARFQRLFGNPVGTESVQFNKDTGAPEAVVIDSTQPAANRIEVKDVTPAETPKQSEGLRDMSNVSDINDAIGKSFDELNKEFKDTLEGNGVTQEIWDSSDPETRQAFLEC